MSRPIAWHAAKRDAALATTLERIALELLAENDTTAALALVQATGDAALALRLARAVLERSASESDDLAVAEALLMLSHALQADDLSVRAEAESFVVDRLLDPTADPFQRELMLGRLEDSGSQSLLGVSELLIARAPNAESAIDAVMALGRMRSGPDVSRAGDLLRATFFDAGSPTALKHAAMKALLAQDPLAGRDFISVNGIAHVDAAIRELAQTLLAKEP